MPDVIFTEMCKNAFLQFVFINLLNHSLWGALYIWCQKLIKHFVQDFKRKAFFSDSLLGTLCWCKASKINLVILQILRKSSNLSNLETLNLIDTRAIITGRSWREKIFINFAGANFRYFGFSRKKKHTKRSWKMTARPSSCLLPTPSGSFSLIFLILSLCPLV